MTNEEINDLCIRGLSLTQIINITMNRIQPDTSLPRATTISIYTALLSQTSTNAPTATVMQNTLGGNIVWTYDSTGYYVGTNPGAFKENKSWAIITTGGGYQDTPNSYISAFAFFAPGDEDHVYVAIEYNGELSDGNMQQFPIEIKIYNNE